MSKCVCVYTSLQPCLQMSASSAVQLYKGLLKGCSALILEVIHHWHKYSSDSHWPPSVGSSQMKLSADFFIAARRANHGRDQ